MNIKYIPILFCLAVLFFAALIVSQNVSLADKAYQHTQNILSFGERFIGSEGHQKTQKYIQSISHNLGLSANSISSTEKSSMGNISITNWYITLPGKNPKPKETLIFMAHYDSKKIPGITFLGANDAASSVGLLLALIEYFKENPLDVLTLEFLFLDGEESIPVEWSDAESLYGSKLVSKLWSNQKKQENIRALILLDMVGGANTTFCREKNSDISITNEIWFLASLLKEDDLFKEDCYTSVIDDHIPFIEKDFKAINIIASPFPNYWHTKEDTLDKISTKTIEKVGKVLLEYVHKQDEIAWDN